MAEEKMEYCKGCLKHIFLSMVNTYVTDRMVYTEDVMRILDAFGDDYEREIGSGQEWKKKHMPFEVNDEVYGDDEPDRTGVITWIDNERWRMDVLWYNGSCGRDMRPEELHKTGKRIDISQILAQLKGE